MFSKILIANRGEIAVRIVRACREMGIRTVAVYSEPDAGALHAHLADESICIGPANAQGSYLNAHAILSAAVVTNAQAVHPGFGFLAENARFAEMVKNCNMTFIGPKPAAIRQMGDKTLARELMMKTGVPVVPGSDGEIKSDEAALKIAERIGYPVLIKAAAGGGGRGIRRVDSPDELKEAVLSAKAEAKACFADDTIYMEKLVEGARHVEVQLIADDFGSVVHLCERDCSVQRRNQKVIEEALCPRLTPELRERMAADAIKAAKACDYTNVGTVEFLLKGEDYYFMEMNTRIQVEHPVTEVLTGVDIAQEQIRVAAGERLSFSQEDIRPNGHVIECRINAEDPERGFMPSAGEITMLHLPGGPGVRNDTLLYPNCVVQPYYDSMIAKLIVRGDTREKAIARMKCALSEVVIEGIDTNIDFLLEILKTQAFESGEYDTRLLSEIGKG